MIVTTDEFADWLKALSPQERKSVAYVVELLRAQWLQLGFPYSSAISNSKYAFRELRSKQHGQPLRIIYVFDPTRNAVLIIGGDKTGDNRFYEKIIPKAERIWERYLAELKKLAPL